MRDAHLDLKRLSLLAVLALGALAACGDDDAASGDASTMDGPQSPWPDLVTGVEELADLSGCMGEADPPMMLSEHGCFEGEPPMPAEGLLPYDVIAPLWSDDAAKLRFIRLPEASALELTSTGKLGLPPGGVLVKIFERAGQLLETRILARDADGTYRAHTYVWNDEQTDAMRMDTGANIDSASWRAPSQGECRQCHPSGRPLGLDIAQLNHELDYPERSANQLATFAALGWLDVEELEHPSMLDALPAYDDDDAPIEDRARAYLHANCAPCHSPGGSATAEFDISHHVELRLTGVCGAAPQAGDMGIDEAALIAPGAPDRSMVHARMATDDPGWRMPPLGTVDVDAVGVDLIEQWITGLGDCP